MAAAYPQPPSPQEETPPHTLFDIPPAPPAAAPAPPQPDIQAPEVALPAPETGTALQQPAPPAPAPPPVPAFVDRRPPALQEGMATAVLHVDDHGHVQQIIWLVLPYVTFEELQQMETELRQRQYPATGAAYNLAEAIQVPRARPPVSTADP
ncbi:MAG: hypothetical protein N2Z69_02000 [Methylophilaceae bacterium]|nr:hypothetical protein [Methylophilaceae bacterium]